MICHQCDTELNENQHYCSQCGAKVKQVLDKELIIEDTTSLHPEELDEIMVEIEKDPLVIEPTLSNEEQPIIIHTEDPIQPVGQKNETYIKKTNTHTSRFLNYVKAGLKAPFASTNKVTEEDFSFAVTLFVFTVSIIPCTLYLFFSQLLNAATSFYLGTYISLLPFWKTTSSFLFLILTTQTLFILLFITIVKLQRSKTSAKLLFIRYMHISKISILAYAIGFVLAFVNSSLAILLTIGFWGFQLVLVSLLFYIERRENKLLLDPVYNSLFFILGSVCIISITFSNMLANFIYY